MRTIKLNVGLVFEVEGTSTDEQVRAAVLEALEQLARTGAPFALTEADDEVTLRGATLVR